MERTARVGAVIATAAGLYFGIPVLIDLLSNASIPGPPQWLQSFWQWSRPYRMAFIAVLIALSIVGAIVDDNKKTKDGSE